MFRERGNAAASPLLIVISGPSGVGKDSVLARMKELGYPLYYTVTATTRPRRKGEIDGVDYHFLSKTKFEEMVERGAFLEWANVYGNLYGAPKRQIKKALAEGRDAIVKVDVQGAATIKNLVPDAVFIFLMPPSLEKLKDRLRERKSESALDLRIRMETVQREMECLTMFDYGVINPQDQVSKAVAQIDAIVTAEKCRTKPRQVEL